MEVLEGELNVFSIMMWLQAYRNQEVECGGLIGSYIYISGP